MHGNRVLHQVARSGRRPRLAAFGLACLGSGFAIAAIAQVVATGVVTLTGTVESVTKGGLTIATQMASRGSCGFRARDSEASPWPMERCSPRRLT
jgi:hypothetical protein